jgi:hypothetical protein
MSCQLGFVEHIDARRFPDDWSQTAFDDADWPAATEIAAPTGARIRDRLRVTAAHSR